MQPNSDDNSASSQPETNFCMYYNSGLPCPLGPECQKTFVHNPERKRWIHVLYELGIYFKRPNNILCKNKEAYITFVDHLTSLNICHPFYILGKCNYGEWCHHWHTSRMEHKNPLMPRRPYVPKPKDPKLEEWYEVKCKFGPNCKNKDKGCKYSHDGIVQAERPKCIYGMSCKLLNNGCKYLHEDEEDKLGQLGRFCRWGMKCKFKDNGCSFIHKEIINVKCKFGSNCKYRAVGCCYDHNEEVLEKASEKSEKASSEERKNEVFAEEKIKSEKNSENKSGSNHEETEEEEEESIKDSETSSEKNSKESASGGSELDEESNDETPQEEDDSSSATFCHRCPEKKKIIANCMFDCGHKLFCLACAQKTFMNVGKVCTLCFKPVTYIMIKN